MLLLLFALFLLEGLGAKGSRNLYHHHQRRHHQRDLSSMMTMLNTEPSLPSEDPIPAFDKSIDRNITVQLGGTAYLPCKIKNLGNNTVAWIRNRDSHIISTDRDVFIVDDRFSSLHNAATETWTLSIKYVQARDAGSYECQVSTVPKSSTFINLAVVVPKVRIFGNKEIHVKAGSQVQLKCIVSQAVSHPPFVTWYHDGQMVVSTNRRSPVLEKKSRDTIISSFTIKRAVKSDEGNYTCQPANLHTATVRLHVINGELSEPSIQSGHATYTPQIPYLLLALLFIVRFGH